MKKYFVLLVCALALCCVSGGAKTLLERVKIHSQRLNELVSGGQVMTNEASHLLDALADDFAAAEMYATAEEAVRTSAKIRATIFGKESQAYAYSLCRIAGMHIHKSQTDSARILLAEAGRIFGNCKNAEPGFLAYYAGARATLATVSGDIDAALKLTDEATRLFRKDSANFGRYLSQWLAFGINLRMQRGEIPADYRNTFDEIRRLLEERGELDNRIWADALYIKASVELRMRLPQQALEDIEKAIDITDRNFESVNMRHVNQRLLKVNIMQLTLQPTEGIKETDEITDFLKSQGADRKYPLELMAAFGYKARMLCDLGNYVDAIYYADKVIDSDVADDHRRVAMLTRAMALQKGGRFDEAEREAGALYRLPAGHSAILTEYRFLAGLTMAQSAGAQDVERGLQSVAEVKKALQTDAAPWAAQAGFKNILWDLEHTRGLLLLNRFVQSGDRSDMREAEQAFTLADRHLSKSMNYASRESVADKYLSALYAADGQWDKAMECFSRLSEALRSSETIAGFLPSTERQTFTDELTGYPYRVITEIALKSGRRDAVEMLMDHTMLGKSLLLENSRKLDEIGSRLTSPDARRLYAEYKEVSDYAFSAKEGKEDATAVRDRRRRVERALIEHPEVITAMSLATPTWGNVREHLRGGEALVEFVAAPGLRDNGGDSPAYLALVLRPGGTPQLVDLGKMPAFSEDNLDEIYIRVWNPLEGQLRDAGRVFFSPAGVLHALPVECFTGDTDREYRRISSARELLRRGDSASPQGNRQMALFGGITYDSTTAGTPFSFVIAGETTVEGERMRGLEAYRAGIDPLEGASREVDAIGSIMAANYDVKKYKEHEGSERQLRALDGSAPELLHIATHGFYYAPEAKAGVARNLRRMFAFSGELSQAEQAMYRSGLFLSDANDKLRGRVQADENLFDDGIVTARELSDLDLRGVRLCVLSACRSGLGETAPDGLFGLPRALKKAGVQSTVMSLWNVDDKATELLMREFYSRLKAGESPTASLEGARRHLRENTPYSHPRYWSAFILMDDLEDEK